MKKQIHFFKVALLTIIIIGITSCGGSKKKLAHKWVVVSASIYNNITSNSNNEKDVKDREEMEGLYKGQIYDLRSDGTFTIKGKVVAMEGKWENTGNRVLFTGNDGKSALWVCNGEKFEIGHDSSITVKLGVNADDYTRLTLKPAPGETVKTDF